MNKIKIFSIVAVLGVLIVMILLKAVNESKKESFEQIDTSLTVIKNKSETNKEKAGTNSASSFGNYSENVNENDELIKKGYSYDTAQLEQAKKDSVYFLEILHTYQNEAPYFNHEKAHEVAYESLLEILNAEIEAQIKISNYDSMIYRAKDIREKKVLDVKHIVPGQYYPLDIRLHYEVTSEIVTTNGERMKELSTYEVYFEKNIAGRYRISEITLLNYSR